MTVTKRFILLIAAGMPLIFAGYFWGIGMLLFIVYNVLCFTVLGMDIMLTPSAEIFEVGRTGDDRLSIYQTEKIGISIFNKSDNEIKVQVKDSVPDIHFEKIDKIMQKTINPHTMEVFEYEVIPKKRGAFTFGDIYARYLSRFGFYMKNFRIPMHKEYKVYPDLKGLRKYHMSICNNRKYKNGLKSMKMLGTGTSFESLREYIPGDEYRKINWQATARGNKPIINQYEPEKDQNVYALIDCGRPMSYSVRGYNKLDMAVNTALVLSDIVNQNGDKSGMLIFNNDIKNFIYPGKGPGHRNKIMEALYHVEYSNNTSNYEEAFIYLKRNERHRSIIFLFTDFDTIEETEDMIRLLHMVSRNNVVITILIKNESLEKISENKAKTEIDVFNKSVALELLLERKNIIERLNKLGIMCIEGEPENIEINAINKYLQIKNRMYF